MDALHQDIVTDFILSSVEGETVVNIIIYQNRVINTLNTMSDKQQFAFIRAIEDAYIETDIPFYNAIMEFLLDNVF